MAGKLDAIRDWNERARQARYDVARLAALCRVTPRRLRQYFRGSRRCCPRCWLHSLCMKEACHLLLEGWSSKEVASQLNLTHSYFCQVFRQSFRRTPLEFARAPLSTRPEKH